MQAWANSVLSVLFFPPHDIPNKAGFVSNFLDFTRVFDADPMILPIGNAPPPVPRIVLKSRDERYSCEIALDRLSFAYNDTRQQKRTLDGLYPEYRETLHHVIVAAQAGIAVPIVRLGFVTRHTVELGSSANEWLRQTYIRPDRLPLAHETHLNVLHRLEMESFRVNRWIKIWTMRDPNEEQNDPALAVEIDINTFADEPTRFDRSAMVAFYLDAFDRAEKDLKAYVTNLMLNSER